MKHFSIHFCIKVSGALVFLLVLHYMPLSVLESLPAICLWHNLFGITECPGCGMTRAFLCLLHGDISSALAYNKSIIVVVPLLLHIILKRNGVKL